MAAAEHVVNDELLLLDERDGRPNGITPLQRRVVCVS
jgi:hypothetical protein